MLVWEEVEVVEVVFAGMEVVERVCAVLVVVVIEATAVTVKLVVESTVVLVAVVFGTVFA